ncbi:hypothetical protein [Nonomuraea sp. NPDC048901]|uniref:hypothetical protein n=1 Tax=unclassified Nonomuraea TaxID=2593643 RepID=UPI0033EB5772
MGILEWTETTAQITRSSGEQASIRRIHGPEFQGQAQPTLDARDRASAVREEHAEAQLAAVAHMADKYQSEANIKD